MAQDDAPDFDLAAAGLRADTGDVARDLEVLAAKLEGALPGRCTVERRRVRLLGREQRLAALSVDLGELTYRIEVDGRDVAATRGKAVGGVTIKREELGLDDWLRALAADLQERAQTSAEARDALARLLGS